MEKNIYIKPEMEIIEVELQTSVMLGSADVEIDPSDTTDGSFDSNGGFWDTWNK